MVEFREHEIAGVWTATPARRADYRGWFCEAWSARAFAAAGLDRAWLQDNEALSRAPGTVRGLHFQAPPHAQTKLVRVARGAALDVAVDARAGSPTYGRCARVELSAANGVQLFVPAGFLHGYITLEPDTLVAYKVDAYYAPEAEGAVAWDDPDLAIDWGGLAARAVVSDKDSRATAFADFQSPFVYQAGG